MQIREDCCYERRFTVLLIGLDVEVCPRIVSRNGSVQRRR
ncbi:hypothetical protein LF1_54920 [Rubripirellula obstinata]|uniref:Uncharacterized protein n=1 Tax=Rubripirellula obstinata TaxID=406547 RepID=A0A5B1CD62_9BACT|nr:hypothetical protein LF1_54920 [Rubripirellula obstinata]